MRNGRLCKCRRADVMYPFYLLYLFKEFSGNGPADPVTRCQVISKVMNNASPILLYHNICRSWTVFSKIQFAINIIFDQRDIMFCDHIDQFLFIFIGHTATQWIIEIGNHYTGFDRKFFNGFFQAIESIPLTGAGGYLHHF